MKQKEIFHRLTNERCDEVQNLSRQIDFNNLTYYSKTKRTSPKLFNVFKAPLGFSRKIRDRDATLEKQRLTKKCLTQI